MKLCTFSLPTPLGEARRVGVVTDAGIIDATAARIASLEATLSPDAAARVGAAQVPPDMIALIGSGAQALDWVREAIEDLQSHGRDATRQGMSVLHAHDSVRLLAPIPRPPGIACFITWLAHVDDAQEKGYTMLNFPARGSGMRAYYKAVPTAVEGPGTTIPRPPYAAETDVECEMAAVLGVGGRDLSIEEARKAIVGYTIFNDVSYREIQLKEMKFGLGPTKGKDADHSNVLGPWLVTADEVGDAQNLTMSFAINGKEINNYHTSKMAWDFADLVSYLSKGQTIHPGQIVTSGSYPGGSGLDAGIRLEPGDTVAMSIERLGSLVSTLG
jgi:2-keto-4-pentenoate hydratase/2-oxohepta-3-ene-1,7-dioic acid hydratase in catechol pathway